MAAKPKKIVLIQMIQGQKQILIDRYGTLGSPLDEDILNRLSTNRHWTCTGYTVNQFQLISKMYTWGVNLLSYELEGLLILKRRFLHYLNSMSKISC